MKSDNTFNLVAKLSGEMDGLIMAALKEKGVFPWQYCCRALWRQTLHHERVG